MAKTTQWQTIKAGEGDRQVVTDHLVTEAPLEFLLSDTPLAVLMRTPGDDEDLILGFAITEGIVFGPDEVQEVARVEGDPENNRYQLILAAGVQVDPEQFRRSMFSSSSCGVCGKASIDALRVAAPTPPSGPVVGQKRLLELPHLMLSAQSTFHVTGGLHSAAIFTPGGELLVIREDVGRHNAVDKVIGALARRRWPLGELILLVSGRISFEVVQKAAVAGIPMVCGVSAPTSLAVELADELGLTVIGFLRDHGFNLYAGAQRLE